MDAGIAAIISAVISGTAGSSVGIIGAWLVFKAKTRDDKQELINQLQEERNRLDEQAAADRAEFAKQMDRMWKDKAASRQYVGSLVDHIWQRKEPPPPLAPDGYIH